MKNPISHESCFDPNMTGMGRRNPTINSPAHVNNLTVRESETSELRYVDENGNNHSACFSLLLIRMTLNTGCDFEDLADGFGKGCGTMGGDWSGIRDSSHAATEKMLERALNFIHSKLKGR